jgi:ABC-type branched-subunit amino acid transport system ATPase component
MEMLLRARELTKSYGQFVALRNVSFDVTKRWWPWSVPTAPARPRS